MPIETDSEAMERPMVGEAIAKPFGHYVAFNPREPENIYALVSESGGLEARSSDVEWFGMLVRNLVHNRYGRRRNPEDPVKLDFAIFKWRPEDGLWELACRTVPEAEVAR